MNAEYLNNMRVALGMAPVDCEGVDHGLIRSGISYVSAASSELNTQSKTEDDYLEIGISEYALNLPNHSQHLFSSLYSMPSTSPEETPKFSAQSSRRFIQELQEENDPVAINSEVNANLELAAIVRNVYETEDKAPVFNNAKGRQEKRPLSNLERASWSEQDSRKDIHSD